MSYSRQMSRQIAVHYSGTVSYPASEHGGTVSYSGTAYETVVVNVEVDTDPFDASVADCGQTVDELTGSVGVMNAAQCAVISDSATRISQTLINGFFHTVRTDLGTRKAELEQTLQARLVLLRQQAETLLEKKRTMETDYQRTAARYRKLFEDLNKELENRIHEVDQPVFKLVREVDKGSGRMLHSDMVQTAATVSRETDLMKAQLSVATVKQHALGAMQQAQNFLSAKAWTERTLRDAATKGTGQESYLAPVCYMETQGYNGQGWRKCYFPAMQGFSADSDNEASRNAIGAAIAPRSQAEQAQVAACLQNEIARHLPGNDEHTQRVRETINKLSSRQ